MNLSGKRVSFRNIGKKPDVNFRMFRHYHPKETRIDRIVDATPPRKKWGKNGISGDSSAARFFKCAENKNNAFRTEMRVEDMHNILHSNILMLQQQRFYS